MSELLLQIRNRHAPACGNPPSINADDPDIYVGYFQNKFGEQWIFTYDQRDGKAELRGGDVGWDNSCLVQGGQARELVLNDEERDWLRACCAAAGCQ